MIVNSVLKLIGNTPMLKASSLAGDDRADIYVKLEKFSLTGSIKDRALLSMVEQMEQRGELQKGDVIVEPTSGNTGISMAAICNLKGYKAIIVMPETMSVERRDLIAAYGAELILTEGAKGMPGAIAEAENLVKTKHYKMAGQFDNADNPLAHYETTAEELFADLPIVDAFVAGVGTGGTVSGTGKRLKELRPSVEVVAVEPDESPVLSGGNPSPHGIQGIGAGFVPKNYVDGVVDTVERVSTPEARAMAKEFSAAESILVGISSGAAIAAAIRVAKRLGKGKSVVVIAPDGGEKYISMNLYK